MFESLYWFRGLLVSYPSRDYLPRHYWIRFAVLDEEAQGVESK